MRDEYELSTLAHQQPGLAKKSQPNKMKKERTYTQIELKDR